VGAAAGNTASTSDCGQPNVFIGFTRLNIGARNCSGKNRRSVDRSQSFHGQHGSQVTFTHTRSWPNVSARPAPGDDCTGDIGNAGVRLVKVRCTHIALLQIIAPGVRERHLAVIQPTNQGVGNAAEAAGRLWADSARQRMSADGRSLAVNDERWRQGIARAHAVN
jgi:hypothetical protein